MASKIEEAVIYISREAREFDSFGKTKLNKILFAADFYNFGVSGKSITGARYIHLQRGPVPDGLDRVLSSLETQGRINIIEEEYYGKTQHRPIALTEPDMSMFSEDERRVLDNHIKRLGPINATELSEWTHTLVPWLLSKQKDEIPYSTVFMLKKLPVGLEAMQWAKQELERMRHGGYEY